MIKIVHVHIQRLCGSTFLNNPIPRLVRSYSLDDAILFHLSNESQFANVLSITGKMSDLEKRNFRNRIVDMPENEQFVIVATGKYIGEGFDFDRLDTLFLTLPVSWKGTIAQYTGRLHRIHEQKSRVEVYDYVDVRIPQLERMYRKRLKGCKAVGFKVAPKGVATASEDIIYGTDNYQNALLQDLKSAHKEIVLCSPQLLYRKVESFTSLFKDLRKSGVEVNILASESKRPSESTKQQRAKIADLLEKVDVRFSQEQGFNHQFVVIDQRIAWYGSINFLGSNSSDDGAIRIIDPEVATALMEQVEGS